MAFEDVCPERIDLIHKNYRKLCNLLIDIDEWGQVAVIHMLTRYARTQFVDPNKEVTIHSYCKLFKLLLILWLMKHSWKLTLITIFSL